MSTEATHTRVLFTEAGKPLQGLAVRSPTGETVETDANGQIELSFADGGHELEVFREGEWHPQPVLGSEESSLIIVDLARRNTRELKSVRPDTGVLDIGTLNLGKRYKYHEVIGRGGMSVVLRAHDRLLSRDVAIKVLSPALSADLEAQESFLKEARSLATLSHPNLVAVHDIRKEKEQVFIVLEYVEGENLEKIVASVGGLEEQSALRLLVQLARVVSYMHERGVIHRDLKPSNALIRADGTLKLIDFGLARRFDDLFIRGTQVRGTPGYMSPEQFKGEALTPACDVYMLGVCMFQVLTGELPFAKGDMGYAHVHEPAPRVNSVNPKVSEELSDLVDACLQKQPGDRPGDGKELLKLLQQIYQGAAQEESVEDPPTVEFEGDVDEIERLSEPADSEVLLALGPGESDDCEQLETETASASEEPVPPPPPDAAETVEFLVTPSEVEQPKDDAADAVDEAPGRSDAGSDTKPANAPPSLEMDESARRLVETAEVARLAALLADPELRTQLEARRDEKSWMPVLAASMLSALGTAALVHFAVSGPSQTPAQPPAGDPPAAIVEAPSTGTSTPPTETQEGVHAGASGTALEQPVAGTYVDVETTPSGEVAENVPAPADKPITAGTGSSEGTTNAERAENGEKPPPVEVAASANEGADAESDATADGVATTAAEKPDPVEAAVENRETKPEESDANEEGDEVAEAEKPPAETTDPDQRQVRKTRSGFLRPMGGGGSSQGSR